MHNILGVIDFGSPREGGGKLSGGRGTWSRDLSCRIASRRQGSRAAVPRRGRSLGDAGFPQGFGRRAGILPCGAAGIEPPAGGTGQGVRSRGTATGCYLLRSYLLSLLALMGRHRVLPKSLLRLESSCTTSGFEYATWNLLFRLRGRCSEPL
jgi:hypothetical protein